MEDIIEDFAEIEDSQVEFAIRYDKTIIVMKVFQMLAELFGL